MSPSFIQPALRHSTPNIHDSSAGRTMQISARPIQSMAVGLIAAAPFVGSSQPVQTPMGPHRPQVPMPELTAAPFI